MLEQVSGSAGALEPTVAVGLIRALAEVVEKKQVSRQALFTQAQRNLQVLEHPDVRLPQAQWLQLCEVALDLAGHPALGLHFARDLDAHTLNPLADLVLHSATLGHALDTLRRYQGLLWDGDVIQLCHASGRVEVRHPMSRGGNARVNRFVAEALIGVLYKLVERFSRLPCVTQVSFEYAPPEYVSEYRRVFGEDVQFEQAFTGLSFEASSLHLISPFKDPELHEVLRRYADLRLARFFVNAPYSDRICALLVQQSHPRRVSIGSIADAFSLTERTLRRRLVLEGTNYERVMRTALMLLARRYLVEERRTLDETGALLGFMNKCSFHRAFKQWTGTTPSEYLRHARLIARKG